MKIVKFSELVGKVFKDIEYSEDEIIFLGVDGINYRLFHERDCCESVVIEDIVGDLKDLLDSPILLAEEESNNDNPKSDIDDYYSGSHTWTFYNIATIKGHVTIRWYGESNGYYSEEVSTEEFTYLSSDDNKEI